jgi:Ni/Co efflux regulator RcnB
MKPLICSMLAFVLLGGATVGVSVAEADGRKHWKHRHHDDGDHDDDRDRGRRGRYVSQREVYLVREYYRPRYRHEPRPRHGYHRSGYLPRGWHRRVRPYPVYLERDLIALPRGYRRGIIDGHAVVYNGRGLILDVAVLF